MKNGQQEGRGPTDWVREWYMQDLGTSPLIEWLGGITGQTASDCQHHDRSGFLKRGTHSFPIIWLSRVETGMAVWTILVNCWFSSSK